MKRLRSFDDDDSDSDRRSFDRRSSGSDRRFRDGDRIHRSESFSAFRRDFPKGFRSERRDRFGSSASSTSSPLRRLHSENGRHHQRDPDLDRPKVELEAKRDCSSSSSSEMEEGELEPDPDPEPAPSLDPLESVSARDDDVKGESGNDEEKLNVEDEVGEKKIILEDNLVEEEKHGDSDAAVPALETVGTVSKKEESESTIAKNELKVNEEVGLRKEPLEDNEVTETKIVVAEEKQDNNKGKEKIIALSPVQNENMIDEEERPSARGGFKLFFSSDSARGNTGETSTCRHSDEKLELEPLDLSLGLPGVSADNTAKPLQSKPGSPSHVRSLQSMPSSFRTNSDGFTTSISFSGSQTFHHNPSCSLTQNSMDLEQSVGSRPFFQGVDWQAQTSNETKWKGSTGPLLQRVLVNGIPVHAKPETMERQLSLPRQLSPTRSNGCRVDTRSEHSKDKRLLIRESSNSPFRAEQINLVHSAPGFERIISKIVSEPVQVTSRLLEEMNTANVSYLKGFVSEMVSGGDNNSKLHGIQEALQRRPDLTVENLSKCPKALLEILVALKTGVPDFLHRSSANVLSSDLAAIFHNLKCRNLACGSILPVDDCECRVCSQRGGFCSACMCLVCSKFDNASNTCGWVGCDHCIHWCHTDCALKDGRIRNGSCSGTQGMSQLQFHCVACDHPSEMFGFVKDVFMSCVKVWKAETLAKELQYVRRIFAGSNDVKGKRLCAMASQMIMKLEDQGNLSEIANIIVGLFSESEADISTNPTTFFPKEPSANVAEGSNLAAIPSKELTRFPSFASDHVSRRESIHSLSSLDYNRSGRQTADTEIQIRPEKKPVVDELESVVRYKQAEAKMYQERADSARREAEGLKRIAIAKNLQIEEEYTTRIARLQLGEAEERRRKKLEELQVAEREHREYLNMKMRMGAAISELLVKMEATKRKFST